MMSTVKCFIILILLPCTLALVELVQTFPDEEDVCPLEDVVFTCTTTDAPGLIWRQPSFLNIQFNNIAQANITRPEGSFIFVLLNVVDNTTFISTATLESASVSDNSTIITCSDGTNIEEKSISIADGPSMTTNDGQVTLDYNSDSDTVNITWACPTAERCIVVGYRVYIISSIPECSIDENTSKTYFTLNVIDDCQNASYSGSLKSEDGASRTGPPVHFVIGDPGNVTTSTIEYSCECINDTHLNISLEWDPVSSNISSLAVKYLVSVSNETMTVNNNVAQFVVPITDSCFFASIQSTNGFRSGTQISREICDCPKKSTNNTDGSDSGGSGSDGSGSGSGDGGDDDSEVGSDNLPEIIGGVVGGVVVVTGGTTVVLIGGIFIYKKKKGSNSQNKDEKDGEPLKNL